MTRKSAKPKSEKPKPKEHKPGKSESEEHESGESELASDTQAEATDAEEVAKGLRCPQCHCTDLRVSWVRGNLDGSRTRARVCRNCGQRVRTLETAVGEELAS